MKTLMYSLFAMGLLVMASCQSSTASLQRATASSIGSALSSEVTVSNVKRGVSNVSWDAKKGDECYKCEADDMVRRTNCVKTECEN